MNRINMINQKVVLTKNAAKWLLDHPEVYLYPNGGYNYDAGYDACMQHAMLTCLGEDVVGTVIKKGSDDYTWGVEFPTPFGLEFHYYEYPKDIRKV